MSDPSKSPTRTRAKATSVPGSMLDLLGLIPPLGCPSLRTSCAVEGKSLEGAKIGVRLRRLGLAGLGELGDIERRSALEGPVSRESREGVRSAAKCAGYARLESLGVAWNV